MVNERNTQTLLGEEITKRLDQLGMSGRGLCRKVNLSRQTLHTLMYDNQHAFVSSTFDAVDEGLKWPKGTTEGFYRGIANARDLKGGSSVEELIDQYLASILSHVLAMDLQQLEREVLMLEEEMYGRTLPTDEEALAVIGETVQRLRNALMHGPLRKVKDG